MVKLNKKIQINGISEVGESSSPKQAAFMSAAIDVDGRFNISRTIQDKEAFELYKDDVLEDFAAFDNYVYETVNNSDKAPGGGKDAESTQQHRLGE